MQHIKKVPNLIIIVFFLFWIIYFGIIWINALQVRSDGWYSAYLPHWGDGAVHLSYMSAFAYRSVFPETHPLYALHPFTYSFAADMIGGLTTKWGIPLWFSYNLWGFILSIFMLIFLIRLFKRITKSNVMTVLSATLFLTSGGFGFKYLILDKVFPELVPSSPFLPLWLTQRESEGLFWLNTLVGELVPQRAFLLALPLGTWILATIYKRFILNKSIRKRTLFLCGIIFGCFPVIHPHTTMVLALTSVFWIAPSLFGKKAKTITKDLSIIVIPTLIIGGYLTFRFLSPSVSTGFFAWHPGWLTYSKNSNWILFWLNNWGLFLPTALIGTLFAVNKTVKKILIPFWVWFILANLFLFQPYDWDNAKIFTWVYLFFSIPVSAVLVSIWNNHNRGKIVAILLFILLTLSGAVDVFRLLDTDKYSLKLLNSNELRLGQIVRQSTPSDSVILTSTTHRNWVPILTGRQILCGYLGWMWTYGIKADNRVRDIRNIYNGSTMTETLLDKYSIDYVVIGPEERHEFNPNQDYFEKNYRVLAIVDTTTIYAINK